MDEIARAAAATTAFEKRYPIFDLPVVFNVMQTFSSDKPCSFPPRTWPLHVRYFFSAISSALSDSLKKNKGLESPSVGWVLALERDQPSSNEHQRHHWPVPTLLKPSIAVSGSILVTMHHSLLISLKWRGGNGSKRKEFQQNSFYVEQRRGLYLMDSPATIRF